MTEGDESTAEPADANVAWSEVPWGLFATITVTAFALYLLIDGSLAAVLGAWLLATAAPVGLGAIVRHPAAIAAPSLFWLVWLIVVHNQERGGDLPRTPIFLAVMLAIVGTAAVIFAQRKVARSTDPEVRHAPPREVISIDEALSAEPELTPAEGEPDEDEALDDVLLEALIDDELEDEGDEPEGDAEEPDAEDDADEPVAEGEADAAEDEASEEPIAEDETEGEESDAEDEPVAEANEDEADAELVLDEDASTADDEAPSPLHALEAAVASVKAAASGPDANAEGPDAEDNGQAIEFDAISEADLELDGPPLPAQTHAGRGRPSASSKDAE